jgi:type IV secretion system protein VirB8
MNKTARDSLDAYYREAESWSKDRQEELRRSRRIAWIVAAIACSIALLLAIALVFLIPLRTVVPYTLLVDRQTGFVQAVDPIDQQRVSGDAALTQSMLVQYVVARESFDVDQVQSNYRRVALWSAENARSDYLAAMQPSNPASPLARFPRNAIVETQVKSVSPVARNVAMVRYETYLRGADGRPTPLGSWVAMIRYRFSGEPQRVEDRYQNPLGFQVVRYRRDQEALNPQQPVQPAQQAQPGPAAAPANGVAPAPQPAPAQRPPPAPPEVEL